MTAKTREQKAADKLSDDLRVWDKAFDRTLASYARGLCRHAMPLLPHGASGLLRLPLSSRIPCAFVGDAVAALVVPYTCKNGVQKLNAAGIKALTHGGERWCLRLLEQGLRLRILRSASKELARLLLVVAEQASRPKQQATEPDHE